MLARKRSRLGDTINCVTIVPWWMLFVSALLYFPQAVSAPKGWNTSTEPGYLIYSPASLKPGKTFMYRAPAPEVLAAEESMNSWFKRNIEELQRELGEPLEEWKIKTEKNDGLSATSSFTASSGETLSVGYGVWPLDKDRVFLVQMVSSQDVIMVVRYGLAFEKITEDIKQRFLTGELPGPRQQLVARTDSLAPTENTTASHANNPVAKKPEKEKLSKPVAEKNATALQQAIRTFAGKGIPASDLDSIVVDSYIDVMRGKLKPKVYFLFKDGMAYVDATTPPDDFNRSASEQLEGDKKWRPWRKQSDKIQLKNNKGQWKTISSEPAVAGKQDEKLNQQYTNASGSANFGSSTRGITFYPNGRFETSARNIIGGGVGINPAGAPIAVSTSDASGTSTAVSGATAGVANSSSKKANGASNTGTYHIDGYVIELHHDNGYRHRELFLYEGLSRSRMVIGDTIYWKPRK